MRVAVLGTSWVADQLRTWVATTAPFRLVLEAPRAGFTLLIEDTDQECVVVDTPDGPFEDHVIDALRDQARRSPGIGRIVLQAEGGNDEPRVLVIQVPRRFTGKQQHHVAFALWVALLTVVRHGQRASWWDRVIRRRFVGVAIPAFLLCASTAFGQGGRTSQGAAGTDPWEVKFSTPQHIVCDSGCVGGGAAGAVDQGTGGSSAWKVNFGGTAQPVTVANLDIALSALRDAIIGAGPKTLTDVVSALTALTVSVSGTVAVSGTVTANLGTLNGAATSAKQDALLTELQDKADLTETQPVSLASVPSHAVTNAGTFAVQVTSAPTTAVTGTFFQATQPVSLASAPTTPVTGTFFQATQPVSIASMPSTPVTGTFFQATQPVSGTVAVSNMIAAVETGLAKDASLATLNAKDLATGAKQDTGNVALAVIATAVGAIGGAAPTGAEVSAGLAPGNLVRPLRTDPSGVLFVSTPSALTLPPCNPVRRTFCAPKGF